MKILTLFALLSLITAAVKTTKNPVLTTITLAPLPTDDYDFDTWVNILPRNYGTKGWLFEWTEFQKDILWELTGFLQLIYSLISVISILLNLIQLCLLLCKKSHPVFIVLLWICVADMLQSLATWTPMIVGLLFTPYVDNWCDGYPFIYIWALKVVETVKFFSDKLSGLLTVLLAAMGALSVKPITVSWGMVLSFMASFMFSGFFYNQVQIGKYRSCTPHENLGYSYYTLLIGQKWEISYALVDGYFSIIICVGFLIIALSACCRKKNVHPKYGYPIRSSKMILLISISTFLFQLVNGVLTCIDIHILLGYTEQVRFDLYRVVHIALILNSILKCFLYFCVSTKAETPLNSENLVPA